MKTSNIKDKNNIHAGFSLLEVAIVILILGLLALPLAQAFRSYQAARADDTTQDAVANSASALAEYFAINNEYPCPSDPRLPPTSDDNGLEDCAGAQVGNWPLSFANGFDFNGGGAENIDGLPGVDLLYRGALPFRTLGIPYNDSVDGYGSKLTYVVTRAQTPWYAANGGVRDRATLGVIQVEVETGRDIATGLPTYAPVIDILAGNTNDLDLNGLPDDGLLGAIVFSHGLDRRGAFPIWGTPMTTPNPCVAGDGIDEENCNNDAFFRSRGPSEAAGGQYFDDVVAARLWTYQGSWLQNGGQGSISPTAPANLGIGVGLPTERLHVAGNIRADNYMADLICDENLRCFQPALIGGSGFSCPPGRVLRGFHNGREVCSPPVIVPSSVAGQSCGVDGGGAQMFVAGINGDGTLNCVVR